MTEIGDKVEIIRNKLRNVLRRIKKNGWNEPISFELFEDVDRFSVSLIRFDVEDSKEYKRYASMGLVCSLKRSDNGGIRVIIDKVMDEERKITLKLSSLELRLIAYALSHIDWSDYEENLFDGLGVKQASERYDEIMEKLYKI